MGAANAVAPKSSAAHNPNWVTFILILTSVVCRIQSGPQLCASTGKHVPSRAIRHCGVGLWKLCFAAAGRLGSESNPKKKRPQPIARMLVLMLFLVRPSLLNL